MGEKNYALPVFPKEIDFFLLKVKFAESAGRLTVRTLTSVFMHAATLGHIGLLGGVSISVWLRGGR